MNSPASKRISGSRVLNLRATLLLVIVAGGVVFGMRRLHDRQFSATFQFVRETATKSLESHDYRAAQVQFTQYLAMQPGDNDAREKLSMILTDHVGTTPALEQAFRLNEDLLRKGLTNDELRLRQARIAVRLNRMADANAHLAVLQSSQPDDAEVWYLSGVTAESERDTEKAALCLKRSLRCDRKIPDAYAALAGLATNLTPPEFSAAALMARMSAECPTGPAWRIRADYFLLNGQYEEAIGDLWKAIQETPDDAMLNAKLVRCIQTSTRLKQKAGTSPDIRNAAEKAVRHFQERIAANPGNVTLRLHLAAVLWKTGERSRATQELQDSILKMPGTFAIHEALMEYLVAENQSEKARRLLESIPSGGLSREAYHYCLGRILMAEKHWKEAATSFEQTIAFGRKDSGLVMRAQMSYAVCCSHNGESRAALDAFRTVAVSSDDATGARLGMASAWVKSGQLDLAIAEYRQLSDVPGVNAYLTDLLIRRNLLQAASLRNWEEVDKLLTDQDPLIPDPVQRILLRADRLFAAGQIVQAFHVLENAAIRYPERREIASALKRLSGELAPELNERLTLLANESPESAEIQAIFIRQAIATDNPAKALQILDALVDDSHGAPARQENSLLLAVRTVELVLGFDKDSLPEPLSESLREVAVKYARQLTDLNRQHERLLVRSLVRSGKTDEALRVISAVDENENSNQRAASVLELVRLSPSNPKVLTEAARALYSLVGRHPENTELRIHYAEMMLYSRHYELADQTLAPLASADSPDGRVSALRAWLRCATETGLPEASAFAAIAVKSDPRNPLFREVEARVLLSQNSPDEALKVLDTIPANGLSISGQVYRMVALMKLDRISEALTVLDQMRPLTDLDRLLPADEDLLTSIRTQILQPVTRSR